MDYQGAKQRNQGNQGAKQYKYRGTAKTEQSDESRESVADSDELPESLGSEIL